MNAERDKLVEHLFRTEYGKLVSSLTRFFGPSYIQLAEDVVQDTLISALNNWGTSGIPNNPTGWLIQVAKRKALNEFKRGEVKKRFLEAGQNTSSVHHELDEIFLENEIQDNQLRMMFACCHDDLSIESQLALTLKTLCGFGVTEVAKALLSNTSTINKRLYRAKEKIRKSNKPFVIPQGAELERRIDAVILCLYLLFNEGYNSSSSEIIRKDLCLEAIRLGKLMENHFKGEPKIAAFLALMCFHTARFDARIDDNGALVLFEDQKRGIWNSELIHMGMMFLKKSIGGKSISVYHIEARIAAEHCMAGSFEQTNWSVILEQYQLLFQLKPNPIIKLNLAIIESKINGLEASLKLLKKLELSADISDYYLLPATQGVFLVQLEQYDRAAEYLQKALHLNPSLIERRYLVQKLEACKKQLPN